jgi:tRNA(Ile)-lysidine synthase TilS/MesJ
MVGHCNLIEDKDMSALRVCTKCVLPETFPGVHFDKEGVCNFCVNYKGVQSNQIIKAKYREMFDALIKKFKGSGTYDALMCYSGGKDSTQTLAILKRKYNLNVLAVSLDNGFLPNQTFKNIRTIVEKLGVDHIFLKPSFGTLIKIFRRCAESEIFSPKTLERASTICTSCMGIIKYSMLRMALEKDIPFVVYGWSPGQAPVTSSVIKNNPQMVKTMQRALYNPLHQIAGDEIKPYFLEEKHFIRSYRFPYYIHPLAFLDYNEETIYQNISLLGWRRPEDVDANSTNCLLNSFANFVHKQNFGFHPYAFEMANLVREGYIDRTKALKRLIQQENPRIIEIVKNKLEGLDDSSDD